VRIGIFGGTFDPIHIGHMAVGSTAMTQLALDRLLFIPAGDPWQMSNKRISPAFDRLAMVRLAIGMTTGFEADRREIDRPGPTYTIDTIESFPPEDHLFVLMGADTALGLPGWHRAEEVQSRASIVVVPRNHVSKGSVTEAVPRAIFVDMEPISISSTSIRSLVRLGEPFRHLVPREVGIYIEENGLYTEDPEDDRVGFSTDTEEQP
jgi:nicotinate-nucleotide adenylyltransferase